VNRDNKFSKIFVKVILFQQTISKIIEPHEQLAYEISVCSSLNIGCT